MRHKTSSAAMDQHEPMSLRTAAKLAGAPREYLEECIAAGRLAVHLHQKNGAAKYRVSRAAMESAGILPAVSEPTGSERDDALVQLLREQSERLAAAEEQCFQLAGQLGAALERNRLLEERILELTDSSKIAGAVDAFTAPAAVAGAMPQSSSFAPSRPVAPSVESSHPATLTLATRISGLNPAARWTRLALLMIPLARSFIKPRPREPSAN